MKNRKTWNFEGESAALNALQQMYGEQGCKESQYLLAKSLMMQSQKESDFMKAELALNWLLKAANLGHKEALITLHTCYRNNCGVSNSNKHLIEKCLRRTGKEIKAEIIGHALFIMITDNFEAEISRNLAAVRLTSILVGKQCNKEYENKDIVDDKNVINEQYLINCVNDLFSFKNPELLLSDCIEVKSESKLTQLTKNICEVSSNTLKIIPTLVIVVTLQYMLKCTFCQSICEEVDFDVRLINKMVVIAAFHISMRFVYQEQQFINYCNWTKLLNALGESFADEQKGNFYGDFKKTSFFMIFILCFAIYTKFIIVDQKDSTLACLTLLSLAVNLHSFFRQFTFHKKFVTTTLMSSLAIAFLEPRLTQKGIIVFETIDFIIFLVNLKKREQKNRINLYRYVFPLFFLKLWLQMSVHLLRDTNDFKPLLSSIVPVFIAAATIPKLVNIWLLLVLGTRFCSQFDVFKYEMLINAFILMAIYMISLKTKWKFIALLCSILSVTCLIIAGQNNGFNKEVSREVKTWELIYEHCYRDNEMKSIEKCFNLRDNIVVTADAVVNSFRIVNHRNRMKQLIATVPWNLIRNKLMCFLGIIENSDIELFNECNLKNWDIYEFELMATTTTTNTSLKLRCTQNIQQIITDMVEGNIYKLLFKITDIPSASGQLLNATCSSCWQITKPKLS